MDIGTIIVAVIFISILTLPFIFMHQHRLKLGRKWFHLLNDIAHKQDCRITRHEFGRKYALGLDSRNAFFFFVTKKENEYVHAFSKLYGIQKARAFRQTSNVNALAHADSTLQSEQIGILLAPIDKARGEQQFILFDQVKDGLPGDEWSIAESWAKLINELLSHPDRK